MPRYLVKLQYDGHLFSGWQIQTNQRTVQGEIEKALAIIAKINIRITGSGRTDSGVHALEQYAHFDLPFEIKAAALVKAMNSLLPGDIRIIDAQGIIDTFNARYDAYQRSYIYRFSFDDNPFQRYYVSQIKKKRFDKEVFSRSLKLFTGKHDFYSFSKYNPDIKSTICTVQEIKYRSAGSIEEVIISADRFLHNMVRRIIGSSINVGHEKKDPVIISELLDNPVSGQPIIYTAPPEGLYLQHVHYNDVDI